ncbi:MAG: hypothetical protein QOD55_1851 [Solirubrobacteraceae bacterium]|nr:hypothetical protein [Solirubrobacteraceae bacterium]
MQRMRTLRAGNRWRMSTLALTVLAQSSQSAPDEGVGAGLIVGTLVAIVVVVAIIWFVLTRTTRASRGGVEAPEGERRRGDPPVESIERGS